MNFNRKGQATGMQYAMIGLIVIAIIISGVSLAMVSSIPTDTVTEDDLSEMKSDLSSEIGGVSDEVSSVGSAVSGLEGLSSKVSGLEQGQSQILEALGEKAPARISVTSVNAPSQVAPGETITVSAVVTNTGGQEGSESLDFTVGGSVVSSKSVTLGPGETKTVSFTTSQPSEGTYSVGVAGISASVKVVAVGEEEEEEEEEEKMPWEMIDWNSPKPWPERLKGFELGTVPDKWIEYQPDIEKSIDIYGTDTCAVSGYDWPEGWEEAIEGVDELTWFNYGGGSHDPAMTLAAAAYEDKTGIHIKVQAMEELGLWMKTVSAMTAKNPKPDFIHVNPLRNGQQIVASGWVQQIDWFWPEEVQALYSNAQWSQCKVGDHWYNTTAASMKPHLIFYRPAVFKEVTGSAEPPSDFESLMDACAKIAEETDMYGFSPSGKDYRYMCQRYLFPLVNSQGGKIVIDGKFTTDTPEFEKAFEALVEMVESGAAPTESFGWSWTDAPAVFEQGKSAVFWGGTVNVGRWWKKTPKALVEPSPDPADGGWWAINGWSLTKDDDIASTNSPNGSWYVNNYAPPKVKAACLLFGDLYRSYQAQWNEVGFEGNEAMIPALYETESVGAKPMADLKKEAVATAVGEAMPVNSEQMQKFVYEWWQKAATGEISVDEALSNLKEDIAAIQPE